MDLVTVNVNSTAGYPDQLTIEANRVRDSGVLGDARLRQLFDYLLDKTLAGESPKEIVIAMDVFNKGSSFNVGEDALVRVYVHKLRKALSSFYGSAAAAGGNSIQLPKGDYRLHLRIPVPETPAPDAQSGPKRLALARRVSPWVAICSTMSLLAVALTLFIAHEIGNQDGLTDIRRSPVWSDLLSDERPIIIAIGDYYLLGETDNSKNVKRLIREFDINSRTDLDRYRMQHPADARHLVDVGFRYLPTSSADALRHVMAVLAPADRRITVRMMSELQVSAFKTSDVIYIGFVSGLGVLQEPAFKGSRLQVGGSYDELVDVTNGRSYVSQELTLVQDEDNPSESRRPYHDYGLFAKFRGPAGNTMLIIAGTRDEGVEETGEELTNALALKGITERVDATKGFEGLLDVGAVEGVDMSGRLIFVVPRSPPEVTPPESKAAPISP